MIIHRYIGQRRDKTLGREDWVESAPIAGINATYPLVVRVWGNGTIGYATNSLLPFDMRRGMNSFKWFYNKTIQAIITASQDVEITPDILKAITVLRYKSEFIGRTDKILKIEELMDMQKRHGAT
jgi:hypothetical protein